MAFRRKSKAKAFVESMVASVVLDCVRTNKSALLFSAKGLIAISKFQWVSMEIEFLPHQRIAIGFPSSAIKLGFKNIVTQKSQNDKRIDVFATSLVFMVSDFAV